MDDYERGFKDGKTTGSACLEHNIRREFNLDPNKSLEDAIRAKINNAAADALETGRRESAQEYIPRARRDGRNTLEAEVRAEFGIAHLPWDKPLSEALRLRVFDPLVSMRQAKDSVIDKLKAERDALQAELAELRAAFARDRATTRVEGYVEAAEEVQKATGALCRGSISDMIRQAIERLKAEHRAEYYDRGVRDGRSVLAKEHLVELRRATNAPDGTPEAVVRHAIDREVNNATLFSAWREWQGKQPTHVRAERDALLEAVRKPIDSAARLDSDIRRAFQLGDGPLIEAIRARIDDAIEGERRAANTHRRIAGCW